MRGMFGSRDRTNACLITPRPRQLWIYGRAQAGRQVEEGKTGKEEMEQ